MPQPRSNGVDVHPRTQRMAGRRMSHDMRAHTFSPKRRHHFPGSGYRTFDEGVNAKAGKGRTAHIEKCESIGRSLETRAQQGTQDLGGVWPQRTRPNLASLSQNSNGGRGSQIQVSYGEVSGFTGTGTGVVKEEEQRVISLALGSATIRECQESVHFIFFEIRQGGRDGLTPRHRFDLGSEVNQLRNTLADEMEERTNGGETLVDGRQRTAAFLLEVGQKVPDRLRLHILDGQMRRV